MVNSRVDRYRDLRSGLKEEAGISRENINIVKDDYLNDDENDDFLTSVNRFFYKKNDNELEDTLIEAKTFEQMRNENNEELDRALRSAKVSVGKSDKYNTRMDILNKIREPEKQVVRVNNFDNVKTSEFSKGYFVNPEARANTEDMIEIDESPKEKMTLMERLASMSPIEDAKKAKIILGNSEEKNISENDEDVKENVNTIEQTDSLEDMLRQIKEKDQREVEKVLMKKEVQVAKEEAIAKTEDKTVTREEINEDKKNNRIVNVLNIIIVVLVVVFVVLCAMIAYQLFF